MRPLHFSTALGLLVIGAHVAACLDVDDAVLQFCIKSPGACRDGGEAAASDGDGVLDGDGGDDVPDGGYTGDDGATDDDGGSDAGPDRGPPDSGREPPGWKLVPSMQMRRTGHTATDLKNGQVLVIGGCTTSISQGCSPTNTAELYTVSSNRWSPAKSLKTARTGHTATLLNDGRVLVVGGRGFTDEALATAEVYDVDTNTWTDALSIPNGARAWHAAILLASGKVLVAGGGTSDSTGLNTTALFDPNNDTWTDAGNMGFKRNVLTLTLLNGDKVVAIGGYSETGAERSAEVYDSSQVHAGWQRIEERMSNGRNGHTATHLPSGKILVAGSLLGSPGTVLRDVDLFDPGNWSWSPQQDLREARFAHSATLLPSGEVLVVGGNSLSNGAPRASAEIFRQNGTWELLSPMSCARASHTATWLDSGSVLIIGGTASNGEILNTVERFVP